MSLSSLPLRTPTAENGLNESGYGPAVAHRLMRWRNDIKWAVFLALVFVLDAGRLAASAEENVRPTVVVVRNYLTVPKLGDGSDPGSPASTAS